MASRISSTTPAKARTGSISTKKASIQQQIEGLITDTDTNPIEAHTLIALKSPRLALQDQADGSSQTKSLALQHGLPENVRFSPDRVARLIAALSTARLELSSCLPFEIFQTIERSIEYVPYGNSQDTLCIEISSIFDIPSPAMNGKSGASAVGTAPLSVVHTMPVTFWADPEHIYVELPGGISLRLPLSLGEILPQLETSAHHSPRGSGRSHQNLLPIPGNLFGEERESDADYTVDEVVCEVYQAINRRNLALGLTMPRHATSSNFNHRVVSRPDPIPITKADFASISTGPVSQTMRRSCGGPAFWEQDTARKQVRSTPIAGQRERVFSVYQPLDPVPIMPDDSGERAINDAMTRYLASSWRRVEALGPIAADWFDLLVSLHMGRDGQGWRQRSRDNPGTWSAVSIDALVKIRDGDRYHGFSSKEERFAHHRALSAVLQMQLSWERDDLNGAESARPVTNGGKGRPAKVKHSELMHYWQYTQAQSQEDSDGAWRLHQCRFFPTWWFDVEMGVLDNHAPQMFAAGLLTVLQIPVKKEAAKSVARFAVTSFWRQRATKPGDDWAISLRELHDLAGLEIPEWAKTRPGEYVKRFGEQIGFLCGNEVDKSTGEPLCLIAPFTMPKPTGRGGTAFDRWLSEPVELRPHPNVPAPIKIALNRLSERGAAWRKRHEAAQIQAESRMLVAAKR